MPLVPDPTDLRNVLIVDICDVDDMNSNGNENDAVAEIVTRLIAIPCYSSSSSTSREGVGEGDGSKYIINMDKSTNPAGGLLRALSYVKIIITIPALNHIVLWGKGKGTRRTGRGTCIGIMSEGTASCYLVRSPPSYYGVDEKGSPIPEYR